MQRRYILFFIFTVIAVVAMLIYRHWTPPKDETGNWEIHQSVAGFSIKCPPSFQGYFDVPNDTTAYRDGFKTGCLSDNGLAGLEVVSWTKFTEEIWGKDFTYEDFLKNEVEIAQNADSGFNREEISLDNNPGVKITYTENLGENETRKRINIYLKIDETMYNIRAVINSVKENRYLAVIEKIISTFKSSRKDQLNTFCGLSTLGGCVDDAECVKGGCSGDVCQSINEVPAITTCEWKDCYSAEKYGLKCKCTAEKCQWSK
jgi:eight-cysteine-cluster-containing protein